MIVAGMVKRTKRTMQNIERQFLDPLVRKTLWRYMQFAPQRYPVKDYKFVVHSTMGIMAREFEQTQLTQLLSTVPPASPAYWLLLRSIYSNSSMTDKEEMLAVIDQMVEQASQPQQQQPQDLAGMARMENAQTDKMRLQFEMAETEKRLQMEQLDRVLKNRELDIREKELMVEVEKVRSSAEKARADSILAIAKAEAEELGSQLEQYKASVESMMRDRDTKIEALDRIMEYQKGLAEAKKAEQPQQQQTTPSYDDTELKQMISQLAQTQRQQPAESPGMMAEQPDYSGKLDEMRNMLAELRGRVDNRASGPIQIELKRMNEQPI